MDDNDLFELLDLNVLLLVKLRSLALRVEVHRVK